MNAEDFKNIAEAIQAIAVTTALIVGGVWSLFTFRALQSKRKAQLELDEAERRIRGMAVVNVDLQIEPVQSPTPNTHLVHVIATIHNCGSRNTVISFDGYPLLIQELIVDEESLCIVREYVGDNLSYQHPIDESTGAWAPGATDVCTVRSGMSFSLDFLVGVRRPGLYRAVFDTAVSAEEHRVAEEAGMRVTPDMRLTWGTERFFSLTGVPESPKQSENARNRIKLAGDLTTYSAGIAKAIKRLESTEEMQDDDAKVKLDDAKNKLTVTLEAMLDLRSVLIFSPDSSLSEFITLFDTLLYYMADPSVNSFVSLEFLSDELQAWNAEARGTT